jgi:methylmalonyl-CoA mutase C-terminal domain/subunit
MIAETAVQEDVDGIGLSILSGAHMTLFPQLLKELEKRGAGEVVVFGGGIVPDSDIKELKKMGVKAVFTPGESTEKIVEWVRANVADAA